MIRLSTLYFIIRIYTELEDRYHLKLYNSLRLDDKIDWGTVYQTVYPIVDSNHGILNLPSVQPGSGNLRIFSPRTKFSQTLSSNEGAGLCTEKIEYSLSQIKNIEAKEFFIPLILQEFPQWCEGTEVRWDEGLAPVWSEQRQCYGKIERQLSDFFVSFYKTDVEGVVYPRLFELRRAIQAREEANKVFEQKMLNKHRIQLPSGCQANFAKKLKNLVPDAETISKSLKNKCPLLYLVADAYKFGERMESNLHFLGEALSPYQSSNPAKQVAQKTSEDISSSLSNMTILSEKGGINNRASVSKIVSLNLNNKTTIVQPERSTNDKKQETLDQQREFQQKQREDEYRQIK